MKKKDDLDYLFKKNNNNKEDQFDNLFKKSNDKDFSNIDSEINKILGKDMGLNYNNNFPLKFKTHNLNSNITNVNGINLGEKPYERPNLKPLNNIGGRRGGGGGLMAIGYEPNKNSIFSDMNFGGFGLNKNKQDNNKFGFKRDLQPLILKEKKNDLYGFNNKEDKYSYKNPNNIFGNDKFSKFEKENNLANKFNNEHTNIFQRRKINYYSSPNSLPWGGL